jgi:hypothetical protein
MQQPILTPAHLKKRDLLEELFLSLGYFSINRSIYQLHRIWKNIPAGVTRYELTPRSSNTLRIAVG